MSNQRGGRVGCICVLPNPSTERAMLLDDTWGFALPFCPGKSGVRAGVQALPGYLSPGPSANSFNSTDSYSHDITCHEIKLHTRQGPPPAWFQQAAMDPCSYNYAFCSCAGDYHLQVRGHMSSHLCLLPALDKSWLPLGGLYPSHCMHDWVAMHSWAFMSMQLSWTTFHRVNVGVYDIAAMKCLSVRPCCLCSHAAAESCAL